MTIMIISNRPGARTEQCRMIIILLLMVSVVAQNNNDNQESDHEEPLFITEDFIPITNQQHNPSNFIRDNNVNSFSNINFRPEANNVFFRQGFSNASPPNVNVFPRQSILSQQSAFQMSRPLNNLGQNWATPTFHINSPQSVVQFVDPVTQLADHNLGNIGSSINTGNLPNTFSATNSPNMLHSGLVNARNFPNALQRQATNTGNLLNTLQTGNLQRTGIIPNSPNLPNNQILPTTGILQNNGFFPSTRNVPNTVILQNRISTNTGRTRTIRNNGIITSSPTLANTGIIPNTGILPNGNGGTRFVRNNMIVPSNRISQNTGILRRTGIVPNNGVSPNALLPSNGGTRLTRNSMVLPRTRLLPNTGILQSTTIVPNTGFFLNRILPSTGSTRINRNNRILPSTRILQNTGIIPNTGSLSTDGISSNTRSVFQPVVFNTGNLANPLQSNFRNMDHSPNITQPLLTDTVSLKPHNLHTGVVNSRNLPNFPSDIQNEVNNAANIPASKSLLNSENSKRNNIGNSNLPLVINSRFSGTGDFINSKHSDAGNERIDIQRSDVVNIGKPRKILQPKVPEVKLLQLIHSMRMTGDVKKRVNKLKQDRTFTITSQTKGPVPEKVKSKVSPLLSTSQKSNSIETVKGLKPVSPHQRTRSSFPQDNALPLHESIIFVDPTRVKGGIKHTQKETNSNAKHKHGKSRKSKLLSKRDQVLQSFIRDFVKSRALRKQKSKHKSSFSKVGSDLIFRRSQNTKKLRKSVLTRGTKSKNKPHGKFKHPLVSQPTRFLRLRKHNKEIKPVIPHTMNIGNTNPKYGPLVSEPIKKPFISKRRRVHEKHLLQQKFGSSRPVNSKQGFILRKIRNWKNHNGRKMRRQ